VAVEVGTPEVDWRALNRSGERFELVYEEADGGKRFALKDCVVNEISKPFSEGGEHKLSVKITALDELVPLSLQIARFKLLDAHRKALRRGEYHQVPVEALQLADPRGNPGLEAEQKQLLERLRAGAPSGNGNSHIRLMLIGSENDDTTFVKMVEDSGADIVIDEHCTGTRYFWNEVEPQPDRLAAIAARYIDRPPCPSKDWPERRRVPHIMTLAQDYGVQGAVLIQQKFCDPHEFDMPAIADALKKEGIPSYNLEFDVTLPMGQFKIRMEAFLEMLRGEELF